MSTSAGGAIWRDFLWAPLDEPSGSGLPRCKPSGNQEPAHGPACPWRPRGRAVPCFVSGTT
eukprot:3958089-Prymnesium_polylepis.2